MYRYLRLLLTTVLIGCKGSDAPGNGQQFPELDAPLADYELLFMGNSHSAANHLPQLVTTLIKQDGRNKGANAFNAPGWYFLDERLDDRYSYDYLKGRKWTHVILQAQKYSTTGQYFYPTDAAITWIQRTKQQGAIPILFPEWPRKGNFEEGQRVHNLHVGIAMTEPACVAPIGLAWDLAIALDPAINLHAADGNHSNLAGALLSAFVFYQVITGLSVTELPYIKDIAVTENTQLFLKEVAAQTLNNHPPCFNYPK